MGALSVDLKLTDVQSVVDDAKAAFLRRGARKPSRWAGTSWFPATLCDSRGTSKVKPDPGEFNEMIVQIPLTGGTP